jgi:hypothetical protein
MPIEAYIKIMLQCISALDKASGGAIQLDLITEMGVKDQWADASTMDPALFTHIDPTTWQSFEPLRRGRSTRGLQRRFRSRGCRGTGWPCPNSGTPQATHLHQRVINVN